MNNPLRFQDVVDLMRRLDDQRPAWQSHPKGVLEATEYLPEGDETVYVLNSPLQEEPMVIGRPELLDKIRSITGAPDREIASFYVHRAESRDWLENGVRPDRNER
jgi:hypothetical protein